MRRSFSLTLLIALLLLAAHGASAQEPPLIPLGEPLVTAYPPAGVLDVAVRPNYLLDAGGWVVYALLDDHSLMVYAASALPGGALEPVAGSPLALGADGREAIALALSPDGTRLYVAFRGTADGSDLTPIAVYDVTGFPALLGEFGVPALDQALSDLAVSGNGHLLLYGPLLTGGLADPQLAIFPVPPLGAVEPAAEALVASYSPEMAIAWVQTLYDRVQADAVNAPAAARLFGYAGVALYEGLVQGMPAHRSLAGQLVGLAELPQPRSGQVYDWPTAAAASLRVVLSGLMGDASPDSAAAFAALYEAQVAERRLAYSSADVVDASSKYGEAVGAAVLDWAQSDGYTETRALTAAYEPPTGDPALWRPTTAGRPPVEPYWGSLRPFALEYADQCATPMNAPYSEDESSTFYRQALEVMTTEQALTPEQRAMAEWWVDTPGATGAPAGHWMLIGSQVIVQHGFTLDQAAELYGMLGMTLADSFISTWSLKYQINLLRPVTYIQAFIDSRWQPYIESPSFPEYPSGHSVTSAAAAEMLTSLYGALAFTDGAHVARGLEPRSYTSFEAAASEAAFSRLYGGIHFRQAIENGLRQGRCVTDRILDVVTMRQFGQNE